MIPSRLHALADYLLPAVIAALSLSPRRGQATRRIMQAGPVWHYGYTVLTRYEGGLVPSIPMRTHLACDAAGALTFVGAAALLQDEPVRDRLLLAALGLSELAVIALSDRDAPAERQRTPAPQHRLPSQ
jgi:hypothetical protein